MSEKSTSEELESRLTVILRKGCQILIIIAFLSLLGLYDHIGYDEMMDWVEDTFK
ncbi:MAG: hypothetical protein M2R45_04312 [Verrucomicrobia subdivision 3 bacterium]|nr:hypothetical protein [Limisphaerales bacterium]MCS1417227.1 hypothetical protein [Limisphaerales bacterium]